MNDPITCPVCATLLRKAGGIGWYCPNERCCILDEIVQAERDPIPFIERNARLKRIKIRGISLKSRLNTGRARCIPSRVSSPTECADCGHYYKPHNLMEMMPIRGNVYIETLCIRCAIARLFNEAYEKDKQEQ